MKRGLFLIALTVACGGWSPTRDPSEVVGHPVRVERAGHVYVLDKPVACNAMASHLLFAEDATYCRDAETTFDLLRDRTLVYESHAVLVAAAVLVSVLTTLFVVATALGGAAASGFRAF